MRTLSIGFDAKRLYYNRSGLGVYSRNLVENLYESYPNEDITLFSKKKKQPLCKESREFTKYKNIYYQGKLSSYWRSFSIYKDINAEHIDIFHGLSNEIPFSSAKIKAKKIVTIHDIIFKKFPEKFPIIDRTIYALKTKFACKHSDAIIAVSQSTKQDIIDHYGVNENNIFVIAPISDKSFYLPQNDNVNIRKLYSLPDSPYILYAGTIEERKNLLLLLKAFKHIPKTLQIPIVAVGKQTSYQKKLNAFLALNPEVSKYIIWINHLHSHSHLKAFFRQASLFVYPSIYEGFGIPVLESLLCKTPVITSNISSLPEVAGSESILIDPLSDEELSVAIEKVLNSTALQKKMKEAGYKHAIQHFSPKILSQKLHKTYKSVVQNRHSR